MYHVLKDHNFKDEELFYRFLKDDVDHGHKDDTCESWATLPEGCYNQSQLKEVMQGKSDLFEKG
jgi:hemerythrin superfamily protein